MNRKTGSLLRVSVATTPAADEAVAELLTQQFGLAASTQTDLARGTTLASVYLEKPARWSGRERDELKARLRRLQAAGLEVGSARISVRRIREEDWAESWKRHFKPFLIGRSLLVKPSWSRRRPLAGQAVIVIDPGLSFGTGQHPTTRFCLQELVAQRNAGKAQSFLDIGSGSGILAIAAARLGYRPVAGFDLDANAVRIARTNARNNTVGGVVRVFRRDLTRIRPTSGARRRYAFVCANLVADLLVAEKARILELAQPGGTLVLAGILNAQFPEVRRAYVAAGARLVRREREGEWASGSFRTRGVS